MLPRSQSVASFGNDMPTYEYGCAKCGHEWETLQRISDEPVRLCVKCDEPAAKRLISKGTGFALRGGGWASDLYGSTKPR